MCLSNVVPDASLTMNRRGWSLSSLMISQIRTIRQFSRGVMGSVRRQICPIRGPRCNDSVHFPRRPKVGMYSFRNRCQKLSIRSRVVLHDERRRSR